MGFCTALLRLTLASALFLLVGTGLCQAQLALDISATPDPVLPGELLRYELTVTNTGGGPVTSAVLDSQASSSTSIVATDGGACVFANCNPPLVRWNLGNVPAGQSVTRQFIVRAGASLTTGTLLSNTARVTATNAAEVDVSRSVSVDAARALVVAIAETTAPAVPGELLTYVVNFANTGTVADEEVMLDALVPAGTQFVSATPGGTEHGGTVTWSLDKLDVGESGERRFTVNVMASDGAVFSAAELHDTLDPTAVWARAEAATPVRAMPPLELDVTLTPDPVQPSELLRYELTVRNRSQFKVTSATLQDLQLDGTTIVEANGGACVFANCRPGLINWALGDLDAGESATRQVTLRADATVAAGTLLFNTAHVAATNAAEVHAERSVPVNATRALVVAIAETTAPAVPGELLTYVVNFANTGTAADEEVMLDALVPPGTQFVSATQGGGQQNGVVSWSLDTVKVGQSGQRRFTVRVMAPGGAVFSAAELRDTLDPTAVRARAEAATPVRAMPPLELDITLTPDPVQPSELLRYEFTVRNRGQFKVTSATLQDLQLDGTTIVEADGGACVFANCRPGLINWALGDLDAGESVTRQVTLRADATVAAGTLLFNAAHVAATNAAQVHAERSVPVGAARALVVAIAETAAPAVPGELLTYVVNFANTGTVADEEVMLDAVVPAGTQFVSATQGGTEHEGTVTWSLDKLDVGESGERRFTVTVMASSGAVFSAAELRDTLNPNEVRARAEAATPVRATPPLELDITLTPDPVQPNELLRYRLTVRNRSQIQVTSATLQDLQLDGTTIVEADGGGCVFANCRPGLINWALGNLDAGQSVTRQLTLRADATVATGTLLFNAAHVAATNAAQVHAERSVPVNAARGLVVAIAETAQPAVPGALLTYVVSFANGGIMAEENVVLQAAVPPGTQFMSAAPGGAQEDGVVTWGLGTVGVGQSGERTFDVQVMPAARPAVYSAAELSDALNPNDVLARGEVATPVQAAPLLVLDATLSPNPAHPNDLVHFEFTVHNPSQTLVKTATLQNLTVDGTTIVATNGGSCVFANCRPGLINWGLGDLPAGQSVTRALDLRIQSGAAGGILVPNAVRVAATNAAAVRLDSSVRVCTVSVCEPLPPTPTNTFGGAPTPTATLPATAATATATLIATNTPSPLPTPTQTNTPLPSNTPTLSPTGAPSGCAGDCDGGGEVTVNELITMVNIALGNPQGATCSAGDADRNGQITVNEIILAVNKALNGCG